MPAIRPVIDRIAARCVLAPLRRPVITAAMRIEAAPLLLLDVTCSDGVTGSAYVFGYTPAGPHGMAAFLHHAGAVLNGAPAGPRDFWRHGEAALRLLGLRGLQRGALSGVEMALWDAAGKRAGLPVCSLLGAAPRPLAAYDSLGVVTPEEAAEWLQPSLDLGFTALKIRLGHGSRADDIASVRAAREFLGDEMRIMVDYNQSMTAPETLLRAERIAEFDLEWLEEPVRAQDAAGHAMIREACPIPVQTGENWETLAEVDTFLKAGACDMAMPDVGKIGGLSGWLEAAALAQAASVPVSNHLYVEASAHVMATLADPGPFEVLNMAAGVLADPLEPVDGTVTAKGPGLGIVWDEDAVAAALY